MPDEPTIEERAREALLEASWGITSRCDAALKALTTAGLAIHDARTHVAVPREISEETIEMACRAYIMAPAVFESRVLWNDEARARMLKEKIASANRDWINLRVPVGAAIAAAILSHEMPPGATVVELRPRRGGGG